MNKGLKMTFRERLADWISGGALTFNLERHGFWMAKAIKRGQRLDRIAAEEKPTSNATVRRMARIARGTE